MSSYERFLAAGGDDSMAAACSPDESGWVIVRDLPGSLGYFDGYQFSRNNLEALRFARRVDAERWLKLMHGESAHSDRIEEHMWIGKSA